MINWSHVVVFESNFYHFLFKLTFKIFFTAWRHVLEKVPSPGKSWFRLIKYTSRRSLQAKWYLTIFWEEEEGVSFHVDFDQKPKTDKEFILLVLRWTERQFSCPMCRTVTKLKSFLQAYDILNVIQIWVDSWFCTRKIKSLWWKYRRILQNNLFV